MYIKQNDIRRPVLLKYLSEGICRVVFQKVKDNSTRTLHCTLNPNLLPPKYLETIQKILGPALDEDLIPAWDVNEGKWKSFRISKIEVFSTEKDMEKAKKEPKEKSTNNKYREKALESWNRQQEQVKQARDIINKLREEAEQRRRLQ